MAPCRGGGHRFDPPRLGGVTLSWSARRRAERAPGVRSTVPLAAPVPDPLDPCGSVWVYGGEKPRKFSDRRAMVCGCLLRTQQCVELVLSRTGDLCQFILGLSFLDPVEGVSPASWS